MATHYDNKGPDDTYVSSGAAFEPTSSTSAHGTRSDDNAAVAVGLQAIEAKSVHWYSYFGTVDFWLVILLGQILALCITSTNTFSSFLASWGTSIPAFQSFFNYVLLTIIYLPIVVFKYGPRKYFRVMWKDGWKYLILSFFDVEGNYFTVLAYRYTNILSAQLINFWSIVIVVAVSFFFLKVRYKPFQILGIVLACGGMAMLIASDHLTGVNGGPGVNLLKGDLFALLGSTLYGLTNVFEEWLVSKKPMYEVLSFIGLFGMIILGVQAAIFDRQSFAEATWNGDVIGYLVGFTLALSLFYTLAPLMFRMSSAAVFNVSLLTGNFWGVIIGIHVFGYAIHFLYPVAFVLIILGLVVYFLAGSILGDSKKPWLGDNQEHGFAGIGTAKLKALNAAKKQGVSAV